MTKIYRILLTCVAVLLGVVGLAIPAQASENQALPTSSTGSLTISQHPAATIPIPLGTTFSAARVLHDAAGLEFDLLTQNGWENAQALTNLPGTASQIAATLELDAPHSAYLAGDFGTATAIFADLPIGLYYVNASDWEGIEPQSLFITIPQTNPLGEGWIYEVRAYPKNSFHPDVALSLEKFIAGVPVNEAGEPILQADPTTGIIPAQQITFRITNTGIEPVTNLQFSDLTLLPPGINALEFPAVPDAAITQVGDEWLATFGDFVLAPGYAIYGFGALPPLAGADIHHHNIATIIGTGTMTQRQATASDHLTIDPADLEITKTVVSVDGEYRAGGAVLWTLTVTNHGPDPAQGVAISDRLVAFPQATITGASFTQLPEAVPNTTSFTPAGAEAWLAYLGVGETAIIEITGVLARDLRPGVTVSNTASVFSVTGDPDLTNNFATADLEIRAAYLTAAYRPVPTTPELALTGAGSRLATLAVVLALAGFALIIRVVLHRREVRLRT